jgi:hypothetical protein
MTRTMLASLALVGLVACGGKPEVAGDASGERNLERAPFASSGTLSDRPVSLTTTPHARSGVPYRRDHGSNHHVAQQQGR